MLREKHRTMDLQYPGMLALMLLLGAALAFVSWQVRRAAERRLQAEMRMASEVERSAPAEQQVTSELVVKRGTNFSGLLQHMDIHLDFRLRQRGGFVDFEKMKLPPGRPVPGREWAAFVAQRDQWMALMPHLPGNQTSSAAESHRPSAP